jgi:hypothetical protein
MYSDPFGEQTISIFSRGPSRQLSVSRWGAFALILLGLIVGLPLTFAAGKF